jgi:putative ABC transport system substrate-binding protein
MIVQRREFIRLVGGAAALSPLLPGLGRAQPAKPVIGYLHSAIAASNARFVAAFNAGLKDGGYVDGQNVVIEYRWAESQVGRLQSLADDLVRHQVAVIATMGGELPLLAAKAATTTIPVVFVMGGDPVKLGAVASLARPGGNVTGIGMFTTALESKRFGLLHEIVPKASIVAVLINPTRAVAQTQFDEVSSAAGTAGVKIALIHATKESDFEQVFRQAAAQGAGAMQICADPYFFSQRKALVALAAQHRMPVMYEWRDFPDVGGLMSYGTDLANAYRENGRYVAKILNGAKPADLPVLQTTKFEFVLNLKTAKALGLDIAPTILARAEEVIE